MDRRRRKDEPFNPFAPNASQKAKVRKDQQSSRGKPQRARPEQKITAPSNDLAAKQKAAMEALKQRQDAAKKASAGPVVVKEEKPTARKNSPQPKAAPPRASIPKTSDSREDRLAQLRAKSAATAAFAAKAADDKKEVAAEPEEVVAAPEIQVEEVVIEEVKEPIFPERPELKPAVANVFKTIVTPPIKADRRPKRRRPGDKRGGGRQPQTRKLDRRKYLEYKYVAKDLLDNSEISEEHRSNVLGQIWAKGERIGVEDAAEFIDQKEAELIIPKEIADEFRKLVRKYTTKR
jgi:hypothetical protein